MNIITTLLGIFFVFVGLPKLFRLKFHRDLFTKYGFPLWLLPCVGLIEASGGIFLLLGTYLTGMEWLFIVGGALVVADMIVVTFTHLRAKEWVVVPVPVILAVVAAVLGISAF
jgi:uncharacterized membrane protein YphA (DoxX/SURF4 family)